MSAGIRVTRRCTCGHRLSPGPMDLFRLLLRKRRPVRDDGKAASRQEFMLGRMRWQRPLVIGASGQVGTELCRALRAGGAGHVLRAGRVDGGRTALDVPLDLTALRTPADAGRVLAVAQPDLILCAGAMTFVDGCEARPREAFQVNAHGPASLASYARGHGVPFVLFSSDYVFDGSAEHPGPYAEADTPRPLNVYGQSKLEGEQAVLRVHPEALVVRTSWVYGPDAAGKNFVSGLVRQLQAGQRMRVPSDQVSTPTLNRDLAQATLALAGAGASGIVHVAGPELMTRLDLARTVAAFFSLDGRLIHGVPTREIGQQALRPLRSGLRSDREGPWHSMLGTRSVHVGLAEMAEMVQV